MPPYAPYSLSLRARSSCSLRRVLRPPEVRRVRCVQDVCRNASSSVSTSKYVAPEQNKAKSPLRRARSSLASASCLQGKGVPRPESVLEPLTQACDALLGVESSRTVSVTVYSEDDTSARDLVTVLLDDPLSSDSSLTSTIQTRLTQEGAEKTVLEFRQPGVESIDRNAVLLPSPFFHRFPHPVVLQELKYSSSSSDAIFHLLKSDVPVFVASPLHTPSPSLLVAFSQSPHAILAIDSALDPASPSADRLRSQVAHRYNCVLERVLLVDTTRALRGAAALSADPSSSSSVRTFQEDILASGVPTLLRTLRDTISLGPAQLRADAENTIVRRALISAKEVVHGAKEEAREVRGRSSELQEEALEARERAEVEILGGDAELAAPGDQGNVGRGVQRIAGELRPVIDGVAWYRLPFVVDDVSVRIDRAVERTFAKIFENELIFQTGRLASLQAQLVSRTTSHLDSLPPAFHSPILHNTIAQIRSSPSFPITASSSFPSISSSSPLVTSTSPPALLAPLRARTAQLAYATRALHLSAQRLIFLTFSNTTLSSLGGALLYVHTSLDASTSVGVGVLGTLIGLRWAVERWARARDKWWAAFARIGDGLARDMSTVLGAVLDRQVCVVPGEACKGVQRLVERREQEIGEVEDEVEEFEASLQSPEKNGKPDRAETDKNREQPSQHAP